MTHMERQFSGRQAIAQAILYHGPMWQMFPCPAKGPNWNQSIYFAILTFYYIELGIAQKKKKELPKKPNED